MNARPRGPEPRALPTELHPDMETAGGIEPPITGLQPVALPFGYAVIAALGVLLRQRVPVSRQAPFSHRHITLSCHLISPTSQSCSHLMVVRPTPWRMAASKPTFQAHSHIWSSEQESNPRQTVYKAAALPSELPEHWSEWGDLNALPRGPRPRALPVELHPDMELDIGFEPITSALRGPRSAN